MKITITVDVDELEDLIANDLRYKALENNGVAVCWPLYNDALQMGLGDYLASDGDYWTPYNDIAKAIIKEIRKCQ